MVKGRSGGFGQLPGEGAGDLVGVEVELVQEERVGADDGDVVRGDRLGWEVAEVERDQDLCVALDRRSEHVAVLRVAGQRLGQSVVVGDLGERKRGGHVGDATLSQLWGEAGPTHEDGAGRSVSA